MSEDLLSYLLKDLRDHVDRLYEVSGHEEPDLEVLDYHHTRALGILDTLQEGAAGSIGTTSRHTKDATV